MHGGNQFLTFNKGRFSLAPARRGRRVWARYCAPIQQLFDNETIIRQYVLNDRQRIYWVEQEFPEEVRTMINGNVVTLLFHEQDISRIEVLFDQTTYGFLLPLNAAINSRVCRTARQQTVLTLEAPSATSPHTPWRQPLFETGEGS